MKAYFRESRDASVAVSVARTLGQTLVFWSVFLWVIPAALARLEEQLGIEVFAPIRAPAVAGFLAASLLGLWSGLTMAVVGGGTPLRRRPPAGW